MLIQTRLDLEEVTREELQSFIDGTPPDATLSTVFGLDHWEDHWRIEVIELKSLWGSGVYLGAAVDFDGLTKERLQQFLDLSDLSAAFFVEIMVVDRSIQRPLILNPVEGVLVANWERESAADD